MSLAIPIEDLCHMQISTQISIEGIPSLDLSLIPSPPDGGSTSSLTCAKSGIMITFRRSFNSDGSGWTLVMSATFPDSRPYARNGDLASIGTNPSDYNISGHEFSYSDLSWAEQNKAQASSAQQSATALPLEFNLISNPATTPGSDEHLNNVDRDMLLQFMGYSCSQQAVVPNDMENIMDCHRGGTVFPTNCNGDLVQSTSFLNEDSLIEMHRSPVNRSRTSDGNRSAGTPGKNLTAAANPDPSLNQRNTRNQTEVVVSHVYSSVHWKYCQKLTAECLQSNPADQFQYPMSNIDGNAIYNLTNILTLGARN
ncbi:hypothetical protein K435DRAFT_855908 [Dendrothele bispora CBS 962.96]|uniref:Uncharacterized protein n=1 Tax=Dendrothele bispora (strain CBS 962.96) TaxID=1314807 RepID=A0A4S8MAD9_DENBC|nr:hypothetical protein K435DRAFT_855908 [Dendrothele bispora CBS 962.96]